MISVDVNVLVTAWWPDVRGHDRAREWLEDVVNSGGLALADLALSGAVRVLTHAKVTRGTIPAHRVLGAADDLRSARGVIHVGPGRDHWRLFRAIVDHTSAVGNEIPDCFLAAIAIEHGLTWASGDRFFGTVPGLDWVDQVGASAGS